MKEQFIVIFGEGAIFAAAAVIIGVVMLVFRSILFLYVGRVASKARKMNMVKGGYLKSIRKAYDKELLLHGRVDNVDIFVEKEMSNLYFGGMSLSFAERLNVQGMLIITLIGFTGVTLGYIRQWSYEDMTALLFASLFMFIVLLSAENLLRVDEELDNLEVRLIDYLENNLKCELLSGERIQDKREREKVSFEQSKERRVQAEMLIEQMRGQEDMKELLQMIEEKLQSPASAVAVTSVEDEESEETQTEEVLLEVLNAFLG